MLLHVYYIVKVYMITFTSLKYVYFKIRCPNFITHEMEIVEYF